MGLVIQMRFNQKLEEERPWNGYGSSLCSQKSKEAGVLAVERARVSAAGKAKVWIT